MFDELIKEDTGWDDLQLDFNRCANAVLTKSALLTTWERGFVIDQMNRAVASDRPMPKLSEKQISVIRSIAQKVGGIGL